jgi:hypothetical protein
MLLAASGLVVPAGGYDADAQDYINRVIAADVAAGNYSGLEVGVQVAYNDFFVGNKTDGNWPFVKTGCILAGARTRVGSYTPLVGTGPTNVGFVDPDYNRKTGLKGDGVKYLQSNRLANEDDPLDIHASVFITEADSRDTQHSFIGTGNTSGHIRLDSTSTNRGFNLRTGASAISASPEGLPPGKATGFYGGSRGADGVAIIRTNGASYPKGVASGSNRTSNIRVFSATGLPVTNARLSFYSIGGALQLALLEARLITLMNALNAAIP